MPQKALQKTRTWGTRFDPLPSSPPASPRPDDSSPKVEEDRSDMPSKKKDEKTPQDASIFVGSLPCNVDQQELARLLSDHLDKHTEIKNIKVVRDSKGGICAFVQCEDAPSAARLIHTLQSSEPRPFLGRILRYEPARAFRTLLISYRTPVQFIPSSNTSSDNVNGGRYAELELPFAMRLWRPWKAKYTSILYNAEAREAENQAVSAFQGRNVTHTFHNPILYLDPLIHDVETIHKVASYFGGLEYLRPVAVSSSLPVTGTSNVDFYTVAARKLYPGPHNALRSSVMDPGCWEVKWNHRDDCVSAWMTLRRVPHLTVTWAHQPLSYGSESHPIATSFSTQHCQHPTPDLSLHEQQLVPLHNEREAVVDKGSRSPFTPSVSMPIGFLEPDPTTPTLNSSSSENWSRHRLSRDRTLLRREPPVADVKNEREISFGTSGIEWTEMDFPPLGMFNGERRAETSVWTDKQMSKLDSELIGSPSCMTSSHRTNIATVQLVNTNVTPQSTRQDQDIEFLPTPELARSPITPKTPRSLFPNTPTCNDGDFPTPTPNDIDGKDPTVYYGELATGGDSQTTIFVGGLEMFGPSAWDEQKLHQFFAKFGMVENVKFVRPLNGRSAFAFVRFSDVHAPTRAVQEAHNSIHDGRQMRVQIRDCNRTTWKSARGRGKYQQYAVQRPHTENLVYSDPKYYPVPKATTHDQRRDFEVTGLSDNNHRHLGNAVQTAAKTEFPTLNTDTVNIRHTPPASMPVEVEASVDERPVGDARGHDQTTGSPGVTLSPGTPAALSSLQHDAYREWYEEPAPTNNPTLPSSASSSSATAAIVPPPLIPYPALNMNFYPPPTWVQHLPPFPLPFPYMAGYTGFTIPALQGNTMSGSPGSDPNGPSTQNAWGTMSGLYGSYRPYTGLPVNMLDQSQTLQTGSQAPVVPTGFIQGDQGTLIAVYHPDALDQYMSTGRPAASPLPQSQSQSGSAWQPPPLSVLTPSLPSQTFVATQPGPYMGWIPGPPQSLPPPPPPFLSPNASADTFMSHHHIPGFRVPHCDITGSTPTSRRSQRRDQQNLHGNRNHYNRTMPNNRYPRGTGGNVDQAIRQEQVSPAQFPPFSTDWGQWTASR